MIKICEDEKFPHRITVIRWLADPDKADFATKCARARDLQADVMDDKILDVADGVAAGLIDPKAGQVAMGGYQWRAERLAPKKYGSRTALEHSGPGGGPVKHVIISSVLDE